ncbi:hypothetical protein [Halobacillus sp. K22]|uniref:hypothetical protein n=1 Tax=Halobacillus sp. K22 TaxID=3457431 RepID=UPI003FCD8ADC
MINKLLSSILLFVLFFIAGCGSEEEADFQGAIHEVKEDRIIVVEDEIDPEATYPTYKILIDESTEFSGEVEVFGELDEFVSQSEQPLVQVWVNDKGENNEIDNRTASKLIVEKSKP